MSCPRTSYRNSKKPTVTPKSVIDHPSLPYLLFLSRLLSISCEMGAPPAAAATAKEPNCETDMNAKRGGASIEWVEWMEKYWMERYDNLALFELKFSEIRYKMFLLMTRPQTTEAAISYEDSKVKRATDQYQKYGFSNILLFFLRNPHTSMTASTKTRL